jgi:hypothetical protein
MNGSEQPKVTSAKKVAANRRNARKSTGPKTANGKHRASRNAMRHGLETIGRHNPSVSSRLNASRRPSAATMQVPRSTSRRSSSPRAKSCFCTSVSPVWPPSSVQEEMRRARTYWFQVSRPTGNGGMRLIVWLVDDRRTRPSCLLEAPMRCASSARKCQRLPVTTGKNPSKWDKIIGHPQYRATAMESCQRQEIHHSPRRAVSSRRCAKRYLI